VTEQALLARHGGVYTDEDRVATRGRSVEDSLAVYAGRVGLDPGDLPAFRAELIDLFLSALPAIRPMPGAVRLVRSLAGRMPLAVASSSPRTVVEEIIVASGLRDAFDTVLSGDDVEHNKPSPDIYTLACRRLAADPADAIAFEDSGPGVMAAVRAGVFCVAVQTDPAIDVAGADLVLPTLELVAVEPPDGGEATT
jgi:HAD superfamily hydrolase (TIGR01509 family)